MHISVFDSVLFRSQARLSGESPGKGSCWRTTCRDDTSSTLFQFGLLDMAVAANQAASSGGVRSAYPHHDAAGCSTAFLLMDVMAG